jgi:hypothetical protein
MSFSEEFGQQILVRVADGQTPENVARQMGRTPATIRHCLSVVGETAIRPQQNLPLRQRAAAFRNELLASLVSRRESRYAAQITRELLQLYWIVTATHPGLPRREIYLKVVMARTGAGEGEAASLLRRAEQSFATWPHERELTFADVVHYLAVSEYLTDGEQIATRIDMGRLVAGRVPREL